MQDNRLLDDLTEANYPSEAIEKLSAYDVSTYTQLLAVLRDKTALPDKRVSACWAVFALGRTIDRRIVVPALLKTLESSHSDLRQTAIRTLVHLNARLAVKHLIAVAQDRTEDVQTRYFAVEALGAIQDERAKPMLQDLVFDQTDSVYVRSAAIEWAYLLLLENNDLTPFIKLLSDSLPDIRFWTVFALANLEGHGYDISPALTSLDHVAAYDHNLPEFWGWHVDREALKPLEAVHFKPHLQSYVDDEGYKVEHPWGMYLLSPVPEYDRYARLYRKWQSDWRYTTEQTSQAELHITREWLQDQLQSRWNSISFDIRQHSQTYTLSWLTQIDGFNLLGGLHRDGYAVVITGNSEAVYQFALWYCSVSHSQELFLYEWASPGIRLHSDMTLKQIRKAINKQYATFVNELKQEK